MGRSCISFLFFVTFYFCSIAHAQLQDYSTYLNGRLPENNGRYKTFKEALILMGKREVKTVVETGTERWADAENSYSGDGGSTIIFGHWAADHDAVMYSVDINQRHLKFAHENTLPFHSHLTLVESDSVQFLRDFDGEIDFLYLDSYDYSEKNPNPPQDHCLREIQAAENKLTEKSVIMIDDCNIPGGGKGLKAIQYLLSRGWILHRNYHQVILIKE